MCFARVLGSLVTIYKLYMSLSERMQSVSAFSSFRTARLWTGNVLSELVEVLRFVLRKVVGAARL